MSPTDPIATRRFAQSNIQLYEDTKLAMWSVRDRKRLGDCYRLVQLHLSARYRGDGRPFLEHLVRTASILLAAGESPVTVTAGLGHALYSHGDFCTGERAGGAEKQLVREILGDRVHELLDAYAAFPWNERSVAQFNHQGVGHGPGQPAFLAAMLTIRIANEIEEAMDKSLLYVVDEVRDGSLRLLKLSTEIAASLDQRGLAELAQSVVNQYESAQSDDLAGDKALSYVLLPPSAMLQPGRGAPELPFRT